MAAAAAVVAAVGIGLAGPAHASMAGPAPAPVSTAHAYVNEALALSHAPVAATRLNINYYKWPESSINGGPAGYDADDPNAGGNGTQQQVWTPNSNNQQLWYVATTVFPGNYYELVNYNGKCLDDTNGGTNNGNKVQLYTCQSGNKNQAWSYNKYSGPNGNYVMWINYNGVCLDDAAPYTDGGKMQMWECHFPPNNDNAEAWQVPANTW